MFAIHHFRPARIAAGSIAIAVSLCLGNCETNAQIDFERAPISYSKTQPNNRITALIADIQSGAVRLENDASHGYLRSLLRHLDVSIATQTLVFSKTSHQRYRISPQAPRALYFNDDVYLGWVQGGDVIEISVADPHLGGVFYTIDQRKVRPKPTLTRQLGRCTLCHASTHSGRIPGHIVRSVYPNANGMPILTAGTFRTTHRSPLSKRWGGWYVTGTHGSQRHMGNVWVEDESAWDELDVESGANVQDLSTRIDLSPYLSPHSDIVALMVLEHQVTMHNLFTRASIDWRLFWKEAQEINREKGIAAENMSAESKQRLKIIARHVVDGLLFKDEAILTSTVRGTSEFQNEFPKLGPADESGRCLRQLDLSTRLFRYPCSYMIYSDVFDALPPRLQESIYQQLSAALQPDANHSEYHIGASDRKAIREILHSTKQGFPGS